jgi:hypothetical protein
VDHKWSTKTSAERDFRLLTEANLSAATLAVYPEMKWYNAWSVLTWQWVALLKYMSLKR